MSRSWFTCRAAGKRGEIAIYDDIGGWGLSAKDFVADVKKLGDLDELTVSINSGGGDVFDGLAIYNTLRAHKARVTTRIDGLAASIASVIAMAGEQIEIPESAYMMIHDPSAIAAGGAEAMRKMGETLDSVKDTLVNIYVRRTGMPADEIESMMSDETWMDGAEAVAKGFATTLIDAPAIAAHIDVSRFTKAPAAVRRVLLPPERHPTMTDDVKTAVDSAPKPDKAAIIDQLVAEGDKKPGGWHAAPPMRDDEPAAAAPKVSAEMEIERRARALAEERAKKIQSVYRAGRSLGLENEAQKLLDQGFDVDEIPDTLIQIFSRRQESAAAVRTMAPTGARVVHDNADPMQITERMADAITAQFVPGYKVKDASREYMTFRVQDFMRSLLDARGHDTRRLTRSQIVDAAMHTTSDFPYLLGTSANKIFAGAYDAAPATFRTVFGRTDLDNFQQHNLIKDGDFPTLAKVLESGEFTYGSMSESQETAQLSTYGRTFAISRQSLMNDSLGRFGNMVAKIGQAVARFENSTAWGVVTANGNTADGVAFFADAAWPTGHANSAISSGNGAISATTLGAGRTKMRLQKSLDGQTLNIAPRYFVVPATKETIAEQILYPTTTVTSSADISTPSMRTLQLIVEPLLDAVASTGTTAWYLFADPLQGAAFIYGYLAGDTAPRVRVNDPFNVDGIEFQVRLDFHAAAVDPRYAFYNKGA